MSTVPLTPPGQTRVPATAARNPTDVLRGEPGDLLRGPGARPRSTAL